MYEMAWKDSLRDRWILANRPPSEIRFIYCDVAYWGEYALSWESIRQYRKSKRESIRLLVGTELTPEYGNPENERERVKKQRQRVAPKTGGAALKLMAFSVPEEHLKYHEALQEALKEHGSVDKARFSEYQMGYKDADGEAQALDLKSHRFEVKFDHEPLWAPIAPVELKRPLLRKPEKAKNPSEFSTTIVCSDLQIPFADEQALSVFYQIVAELKPDNIVQLGDALDLTAYSRFMDSEIYANATQDALFQGLEFFRNLRKLAPSSRITYLEGNHEVRLPKHILMNHKTNFNLRPADEPDGDPLLSVPRMLGLKSVDVEYVSGYPNNRYWINDKLQIIHGATTGKSESKRVNFQEKISTIFGHTHRLGHDKQTINTRDNGEYRVTQNAGTLSRIDTHVPSTKTGYDLSGTPVGGHHENWQQGFCIVTHNENQFFIEEVSIDTFNGYRALFRGRLYEA